MKPTTASYYAFVILAYVGSSVEPLRVPVTSRELSKELGLSQRFLLKILHFLVKGGVLVSMRGSRGGFVLARSAEKITLLHVVEAVGGPVEFRVKTENKVVAVCRAVCSGFRNALGAVTVADLVRKGAEP